MKILLATDHSPLADAATHLLTRLRFASKPDVTVFSAVTRPVTTAAAGLHPAWGRIMDEREREATQANARLVAKLEAVEGKVDSLVRRGHAADEILCVADEIDADLVIMGAKGHSALERITLGSVSDRVATHGKHSTLIARPTGLTEANDRPTKLLVGFDGSKSSQETVAAIGQVAWPEDTEVVLVCVMETVDPFQFDIPQTMGEHWDDERIAAQNALASAAETLADQGIRTTTSLVVSAHAGEELCQQAKEIEADIVFVGDQGHSAIERFVLGSVSRHVLRHSLSSVWIVRGSTGA